VEGPLYEAVLGIKGVQGKAVVLRRGDLEIELFQFTRPLPRPKDPAYPVSDHGITHVCIEVSGVDDEFKRLGAAGVVFHCPPVTFANGARITYARDPDGNVIELWQRAQKRSL